MIAITVNPETYTRRNNDAAIAGAIVAILSETMKVKFAKEVEKFNLIENYNFVGVPDLVWPAYNLYKPICELVGIKPDYLATLIQVKCYDNID